MRFLHTADLHIGRRLAQMSLEEDTQHLLDSLAVAATAHQVDALVIAGDVFDSPTTSEAALLQWENFVRTMAARGIPTLVVSGNHDSGTRLAYGAAFAADKGIHIAGDLRGEIRCVNVGGVNFWLIPFVRPADVRAWGQELGLDVSSVVSYDTALRLVLSYRDRADLYARIDRRVEEMAEEGLFEEVEKLLKEGLSADCTAMQAIGYKEAVLALRGEIGREEALALIRQNSRRYAKRQLTWFGREESAHWIRWEKEPDFDAALQRALGLFST